MKISIFGLGYVGAVSAACLAKSGHHVVGVEPTQSKVTMINAGQSPIIEEGVEELISSAVASGHLRATDDCLTAVCETDLSLVCVGTPSNDNGSLNLDFARQVCQEIGAAIKEKGRYHVVVIRSTILPGSMRGVIIPELERASGLKMGEGFGVCNNPEFLREGTAVFDYFNPPKTVIGECDGQSGDQLASLYEELDAPLLRTDLESAEMVKYVDNVWHALKVGFANEIGNICKALDVDGHHVMDIFCQDTKLNLSPYYLKPGFAFGGSCLPKDVRALTYHARSLDLNTPILNGILPSNENQTRIGINLVTAQNKKKVGILGFSFKSGTDDLRESPMVELIEQLLGKGFELALYDENVKLARLTGANKQYIEEHIPHLSNLMVDTKEDVLAHGDVIVVGTSDPQFRSIRESIEPGKVIIDLVRIGDFRSEESVYEGVCW